MEYMIMKFYEIFMTAALAQAIYVGSPAAALTQKGSSAQKQENELSSAENNLLWFFSIPLVAAEEPKKYKNYKNPATQGYVNNINEETSCRLEKDFGDTVEHSSFSRSAVGQSYRCWFSREDLVGIEHNPGPESYAQIIKFLRNMERETIDPVPTRKRSNSTPNRIRKVRSLEKEILKNERRGKSISKRVVFSPEGFLDPEGLLDVGLDENSRGFLNDLVDRLLSGIKGTEVKIQHDLPFLDKLVSLLDYLKQLPLRAIKFISGILVLIGHFIGGRFQDFISLFVGDLSPQEELLKPEMNIPSAVLSGIVFKKYFSGIVSSKSFEDLFDSMCLLKNDLIQTNGVFSFLHKTFLEITTFVCDVFGIKNPFDIETNPVMIQIQKEAKELVTMYYSQERESYDFARRVIVLHAWMEDFLLDKKRALDPRLKEKVQYWLQRFRPINDYVSRNVNAVNGNRIEPLAILIAGPSGVGKSTFTQPFLLALMNNVMKESERKDFLENHNDYIFFRRSQNEYWDGYKLRNFTIVYDDFAQVRDLPGNPNADAFEIIQLKNCAPMHLHCASIEDKQRNYAQPKIVYATSNISRIHFDSLTCSEAVVRRFDLSYMQVPIREFCIDPTTADAVTCRRLDLEKVRLKYPLVVDDVSTYAIKEVMEYIPWDFHNGMRATGPALSFDELLVLSIQKFKELNSKGDMMLKYLQKMKTYVPPQLEKKNWADYPCPLNKVELRVEMDDGLRSVPSVESVAEMRSESGSEADFLDALEIVDSEKTMIEYMKHWLEEIESTVGTKYFTFGKNFDKPEWINQVFKILVVASTAIGGVYLSYSAMTKFCNWMSGTKEPETNYTKKEVRKGRKNIQKIRKERSNKARDRATLYVPEGSNLDLSAYLSLLKRNMYRIRFNGHELGWILFIKGTTFMIPRHFDDYICSYEMTEDDPQLARGVECLFPETGIVAFVLDWDTDLEFYDTQEYASRPFDYIFARVVDHKIREHRDISHMFMKSDAAQNGERYESQMVVKRDGRLIFQSPVVAFLGNTPYEWDECSYSSRSMMYSVASEKGDCGSPIVCIDPRLKSPKIFGIHTAGGMNQWTQRKNCAGVFIHLEDIEEMLNAFEVPDFNEEIAIDAEADVGADFVTITKRKQPRTPTKTKIIPSVLSPSLWEPKTKPCMLHKFRNKNGEILDPAKIARKNYSHNEVFIDLRIVETIFPTLATFFLQELFERPWDPRVFSYNEAVQGIDGVDYVEAINRSTSPGYPFVLQNPANGKKYWFGDGDKASFEAPGSREIREKVRNIIDKARNGVRTEVIYIDYLKDERKPIEKVDAGKTRQFMACPMDYLLAVRMYFGDFIRHVCKNRIFNGIAVGIDPTEEWSQLASYLMFADGVVFTAGDYSKFDAKIPVPIGFAVLRVIEAYYYNASPDDRRIRQILFMEIINSLHLAEGRVYEFYGGNPSGNPITAVFNSMANIFMMCYVAEKVNVLKSRLQQQEYEDFDKVFKRMRIQTFGDDVVIAYLLRDRDYWSQSALEVNIPRYLGMSYTNEQKSSFSVDARRLTEITFLKRGFKQVDGLWIAPLDLDTCLETLLWQKENASLKELCERVESVLHEISLHGPHCFKNYGETIIKASIERLRYVPKNNTFKKAFDSEFSLHSH